MSTLVVVGYDDPFKAEEVRMKLQKMHKDYLIDLEDAVFAVKDQTGKVKLHQAVNLTAAGAASGGFWGVLLGLIFLNPLLGMAIGATAGAVSGALTDLGINDKFMKDLAATLKPESSALFVLVKKATPDKVLEELAGTGGTVLKSSLSHEDEAKLQAALSAAKAQPISRPPCNVIFVLIAPMNIGAPLLLQLTPGVVRVNPENLKSWNSLAGRSLKAVVCAPIRWVRYGVSS